MWQCLVCQYIYDPNSGDPASDIASGVPFDELPDDWVCPNCSAERDFFTPYTEESDSNIEKDLFASYIDDSEED